MKRTLFDFAFKKKNNQTRNHQTNPFVKKMRRRVRCQPRLLRKKVKRIFEKTATRVMEIVGCEN